MISKYFKNVGFLFFIEITLRFKNLLVLPILTRHLGADGYGIWSQLMIFVAMLMPFSILGTDSAALRFFPTFDYVKRAKIFTAWTLMLMSVSLFIGIIAILLSDFIAKHIFGNSLINFQLVIFASIFLCINVLLTALRNWFRINEAPKMWGIAGLTHAFINICTVILSKNNNLDFLDTIKLILLGDFFCCIFICAYINKLKGWAKPSFNFLPRLVRFGLPIVPTGFCIWGLDYFDRIILLKYESIALIGAYSVAYMLGSMVIQVLTSPVWGMYYPTAALLNEKNDFEKLDELTRYSIYVISFFCLPAICLLGLYGEELIYFIAGSDFLNAGKITWLIALGYFLAMLSSYCEARLGLFYKQYHSSVAMIIALIINVSINLLSIPFLGVLGAAISTLFAFFCQFLYAFYIANKINFFKINFIIIFKLIISSAAMWTSIFFIKHYYYVTSFMELLSIMFLGGVIYMAIIFSTNTISPHIYIKIIGNIKLKK